MSVEATSLCPRKKSVPKSRNVRINFKWYLFSFQYLEMRFSRGVRLCGSIAYIIQMVKSHSLHSISLLNSISFLTFNLIPNIQSHIFQSHTSTTLKFEIIEWDCSFEYNSVFLFQLLQVLYMSIVLYAPSLALNAGTSYGSFTLSESECLSFTLWSRFLVVWSFTL